MKRKRREISTKYVNFVLNEEYCILKYFTDVFLLLPLAHSTPVFLASWSLLNCAGLALALHPL